MAINIAGNPELLMIPVGLNDSHCISINFKYSIFGSDDNCSTIGDTQYKFSKSCKYRSDLQFLRCEFCQIYSK